MGAWVSGSSARLPTTSGNSGVVLAHLPGVRVTGKGKKPFDGGEAAVKDDDYLDLFSGMRIVVIDATDVRSCFGGLVLPCSTELVDFCFFW